MISTYVIFGVCCLALAAAAPSEVKQRIIGGKAAFRAEFPYQVSIRRFVNGYHHSCGGSLITKQHVLTAGHCVNRYLEGGDRTAEFKLLTVYVGSTSFMISGKAYSIDKITLHEGYDDKILTNDIAVIKLKEEVQLSETVQPIPLSTETNFEKGTIMLVSGFGSYTKALGPASIFLQKVNVETITLEECRSHYGKSRIQKTQICTSTANNTGTCSGDSGGPLVYQGKQVGVVSFGSDPCVGKIPNVFTNVGHYTNFIQDCINNM